MKQRGMCEKDNREVDIDAGCPHSKDYCQHRKACLVHFLEQERLREARRNGPDGMAVDASNVNENSSDQR